MARMSKYLTIFLVVILAVYSLLTVMPSNAQSIPKQSVPEFTLEYDKASYNNTDQYTGISQEIDNSTIKISIKNPPINSLSQGYSLYYNIGYKGHFGQNWTYLYYYRNFTLDEGKPPILPATTFELTVVSVPAQYPNNSEIDFEVQAIAMQAGQIKVYNGLYDYYGHYVSGLIVGQTSDWSPTQTLTIPSTSTNDSPSPTVPEFPITLSLVVVLAAVSLLLVIGKRKLTIEHML